MFLKTVFSIARSTFRLYYVMATNSSVVWGCLNTLSFSSHRRGKKIGQRKIRRSWRPDGFRNDFVRKHAVQECCRHMSCMNRSTVLLIAGHVSFIIFQLHNEGIHNSVKVLLGDESLREKNGSDYAPTRHSNPACFLYYCRQVDRDFLITLYYTDVSGLWHPSLRVQTRSRPLDFSGVKILSMPCSRGEVKESVPCPSFVACQRTY